MTRRKQLKANVTDADIRDGIPSDPEKCALALAVKSATNPLAFVCVGRFLVTVDEQFYLLDSNAQEFVQDFDASEGLQDIPPASFILKPISDRTSYKLLERGN